MNKAESSIKTKLSHIISSAYLVNYSNMVSQHSTVRSAPPKTGSLHTHATHHQQIRSPSVKAACLNTELSTIR